MGLFGFIITLITQSSACSSNRSHLWVATGRSLKYRRVLDEDDHIDMDIVRALAFQGVPDMEGLRSIYWKVRLRGAWWCALRLDAGYLHQLTTRARARAHDAHAQLLLGYLPPNKKEWPESLRQSRCAPSPRSRDPNTLQ